jgi:transcriptional regulator with XRE-family HTH domain
METIPERLVRLRKKLELTHEQLAELAGVKVGTVRGYEYGRRNPAAVLHMAALAKALGVSLDELVNGPAEKRKKKGGG